MIDLIKRAINLIDPKPEKDPDSGRSFSENYFWRFSVTTLSWERYEPKWETTDAKRLYVDFIMDDLAELAKDKGLIIKWSCSDSKEYWFGIWDRGCLGPCGTSTCYYAAVVEAWCNLKELEIKASS